MGEQLSTMDNGEDFAMVVADTVDRTVWGNTHLANVLAPHFADFASNEWHLRKGSR